MKNLHGLRTGDEVWEEQMKDPAFRIEWERTALARAVALRLVHYRVEHGLSQTQLARVLGIRQPAVARLENGEHTPSLDTLLRLSGKLGIGFVLEIAPADRPFVLAPSQARDMAVVEKIAAVEMGSHALIMAS